MKIQWCVVVVVVIGVFSAGCASNEKKIGEPEPFNPPPMDYDTARGSDAAEPEEGKWLRADVTLLDLDGESAREMFGLEDPSDIAPRSYDWPAGELAALSAVTTETGEVYQRPSFWADGDAEFELTHRSTHFYVADYEMTNGREFTPVLDEYRNVVDGTINVEDLGDGRFNVTAEFDVQFAGNIQEFTTSLGSAHVATIQIPGVARAQRLGVESLKPGRTAMFQLARLDSGDEALYRLLFVRLVDTRKD